MLSDMVNIKQVILDKIRVRSKLIIPYSSILQHARFSLVDDMADHVILQMESYVWAQPRKLNIRSVSYPADWWEAFKERWFPKWLLKKYPVKYEYEEYPITVLYPEIVADIKGTSLVLSYMDNEPIKRFTYE